MVEGLIAEILARHGSELTPACREELASAFEDLLRAPSVALGSVTAASAGAGETLDLSEAPTARYTWSEGPVAGGARAERLVPERYEDLGLLGFGGMGQVRRVTDRVLEREVALKMVRTGASVASVLRFNREAKITARLQHPGIVPIYDYGQLGNGVPYYTMPVIDGSSLAAAIAAVHQASEGGSWMRSWDGTGLRRLVISFLAAAEAVAYAHSYGVVHRDLKPENIMLGEFGETLVVDWGLARAGSVGEEQQVSGTPAYMAPEQARGEQTTARTDVYGLGAVLYEILCGSPPYDGPDAAEVVRDVKRSPPRPVKVVATVPLPEQLVELCEAAMARDPAERPASAREVADVAASWLDGMRKLDEAKRLLRQAETLFDQVEATRAMASERAAYHAALKVEVGIHGSLEDKRRVWALEDEARNLRRRAALSEQKAIQALRSALKQVPALSAAHERLADYYRQRHSLAEQARDWEEAASTELLLREHDRGAYRRYLAGVGAVSLRTDPAKATVEIYRYEERDRRLRLVSTGQVLRTPLVEVELPVGSYLLRISAQGREVVDYPVLIRREEHWNGVAPGKVAARPVPLPRAGALPKWASYVPGGWTMVCGDPEASPARSRLRLWVDGFVIGRQPVTNADYLAFLNGLVASVGDEEALRYVPRERSATGVGAPNYGFDGSTFELVPDVDGDLWERGWPVLNVDFYGALRYADWLDERLGGGWRLPGEFEWEKAARGVDGRFFPWGDHLDPTWSCCRDAVARGPLPALADEFPIDVSVYGVRHLAGNAADWCWEPFSKHPAIGNGRRYVVPPRDQQNVPRSGRGGYWNALANAARAAQRLRFTDSKYRDGSVSFRLARTFDPSRDC